MSLADVDDCCDEAAPGDVADVPGEAPQVPQAAQAGAEAPIVTLDTLTALQVIGDELVAIREQLAVQNAFMTQVAEMVAQAAPVMDALAQGGVGGIFKLLKG